MVFLKIEETSRVVQHIGLTDPKSSRRVRRNDPARRRAAIDELWAEDGVFYDPSKGAIRGRDAIDRIAGAVKATHPDFRYQVTAAPQEYCDAGMVPWISGRPGEVPAYSGRDFVIVRDGRIVALYMFFDKRP